MFQDEAARQVWLASVAPLENPAVMVRQVSLGWAAVSGVRGLNNPDEGRVPQKPRDSAFEGVINDLLYELEYESNFGSVWPGPRWSLKFNAERRKILRIALAAVRKAKGKR